MLLIGVAILSGILINKAYAQLLFPPRIQILQIRRPNNSFFVTPQEILLKMAPGLSYQQILSILTKYGLREISASPFSGIRRCLVIGPISSSQVVSYLRFEPGVLLAELNRIGQVNATPNDPLSVYQWHLPLMNMNLAWDISTGQGAVVAVLDTGIAFENFDIYGLAPDLAGTSFLPGYDFVNDDPNPDDDEGHGTHIAGTIAQTTNNLVGCAGGAFGATLMPVKVMDNAGNGTLTDIVDGIYFAVNNGAQILNLSLGFGDNPTLSLEEAVNYAADNGCLVVCSAGNYATNLPNYPAAYPACLSVSGVRFDLSFGSYSNYGAYIDLCAPGGDLAVDQNLDGYPDGILQQTHDGDNFLNFGYFMGRGTSWAAANVSAVAALVLSAGGGTLTAAQVRSILETTALDIGDLGWDEYYGWGMVDALAAVQAAAATVITATTLGQIIPFAPQLATSSFLSPFFSSLPSIQPFSLGNISSPLITPSQALSIQTNRTTQGLSRLTQNQSASLALDPMAQIFGASQLFQPFLSFPGSNPSLPSFPGSSPSLPSLPSLPQGSLSFPSIWSAPYQPSRSWLSSSLFYLDPLLFWP